MKQEKADIKKVMQELNKIHEQSNGHSKTLQDHHNHTLTIENFIEKYLPIRIQTQISDTVKAITDKKLKKHLEEYEAAKYEELHSAILRDDGDPAIIKHMQNIAGDSTVQSPKRQLSSSKTMPSEFCKIHHL